MLNILNIIGGVISAFFTDTTYPFTILFAAFFVLGLLSFVTKFRCISALPVLVKHHLPHVSYIKKLHVKRNIMIGYIPILSVSALMLSIPMIYLPLHLCRIVS